MMMRSTLSNGHLSKSAIAASSILASYHSYDCHDISSCVSSYDDSQDDSCSYDDSSYDNSTILSTLLPPSIIEVRTAMEEYAGHAAEIYAIKLERLIGSYRRDLKTLEEKQAHQHPQLTRRRTETRRTERTKKPPTSSEVLVAPLNRIRNPKNTHREKETNKTPKKARSLGKRLVGFFSA